MLAITNTYLNVHLNPKSRVSECFLYVGIVEPLTASKFQPSSWCLSSLCEGGRTLTSAPVSTKNRCPIDLSMI